MGFSRAFSALSVLLVACTSTSTDDTATLGFRVSSAAPSQGDVDVTVAQTPEFRLNAPADPETCTSDAFLLVGMDEDGEFAFELDYAVTLEDDGNKLLLTHSELFLPGYWYVAMSVSTDTPCLSMTGLPLEPYGVEFYVP
jgi:hypothetical protein